MAGFAVITEGHLHVSYFGKETRTRHDLAIYGGLSFICPIYVWGRFLKPEEKLLNKVKRNGVGNGSLQSR